MYSVRAYFQTLHCGNVMNNFPHMLKIISLCSETYNMYLKRKNGTACEQEDLSFKLLLLAFMSTIFSSSSWKLELKIIIVIHLGYLTLQFGSENIPRPQYCLKGQCLRLQCVESLSPPPPFLKPLLPLTSPS